jgi:orotidine-5'-phosphate decarboxylase
MPIIVPAAARDRLIVALDVKDVGAARKIMARIGDAASFYKVGMQLVFAGGLALIPELAAAGKRVFLDMKLLDIDNTVVKAVENIVPLGATFTTIHAYPKAKRAAGSARSDAALGLLGVTVLTSMDDRDLAAAGYAGDAAALVASRAADARTAGMDGIVCSPLEAAAVRKIVGRDMVIVTPGVRPAGGAAGDQKRVMTPAEAIATGADYIVVGRPVTAATDPAGAAAAIVTEIEAGI